MDIIRDTKPRYGRRSTLAKAATGIIILGTLGVGVALGIENRQNSGESIDGLVRFEHPSPTQVTFEPEFRDVEAGYRDEKFIEIDGERYYSEIDGQKVHDYLVDQGLTR